MSEQQQSKAKKSRPSSSSGGGEKKPAVDLEDNPIFNLERGTQANLLSEALLREFMHKRKFLQTLKQFDVENPRNEMTITSRALMQEMMAMQKVMSEMKSQGIDSIVEAVCEHRIQKKGHIQHTNAMKNEVAELERQMKSTMESMEKKKADIEKLKKESNDILMRAQDMATQNAIDASKIGDDVKPKKKKDKKKDGKKNKKNNNKEDNKKKKKEITSIEDLLEDNEDHLAMAAKKAEEIHQEQQIQESLTRHRSILGREGDDDDNKESDDENDHSSSDSDNDEDNNNNPNERSDENTNTSRPPTAASKNTNIISGVPFVSNNASRRQKQQNDDELSVASDDDGRSSSSSSSSTSSEDDYAAGLRAIREANTREHKLSRSNSLSGDGSLPRRRSWNVVGGQSNNNQFEDSQNSGLSPDFRNNQYHDNLHHSASSRGNSNNSAHNNNNNDGSTSSQNVSGGAVPLNDDQVGTNLATSLVALLVGKHKKVPGSFFQPIIFTRVGSRPYGLVQRMGGPCGAIAAIQARVVSQWFFGAASESLKNHPNPSKKVLTALNHAMNSIFEDILTVRALPDEPAVFVIPPPSKDTPYDTLQKQVTALSHCVLLEERDSCYPSELLTEAWTTSPWGLVCFILSCILTRARGQGTTSSPAEVIYSHMDEPRPLIVEHGYCSQEMVNLILCGWATSHVHDGVVHVGGGDGAGVTLRGLYSVKGNNKPLEVGYLSMMEVRKMLTVGTLGKTPQTPVWIIYNESHFTVLFGKDDSCYVKKNDEEGNLLSFDLYYYDPQCEEEEYRLTISPSTMPLPATRANALISYVDQIIRTRKDDAGWENARVSWNGADPLL